MKHGEAASDMAEISEEKLRAIIFEILNMERKNLRSKAKTDQRMSEEIQRIIMEYARQRF